MSILAFLQAGSLVAFGCLLILAAWRDLRTFHISNWLPAAISVLYFVWAAAGLLEGTSTLWQVAIAVAVAGTMFLLGALAFAGGMLGGGDVKLLAATSLFAGPLMLGDFLIVTGVAGGVLALARLMGAPLGPIAAPGRATLRVRLHAPLPYGPAIAAGGLWLAGLLLG